MGEGAVAPFVEGPAVPPDLKERAMRMSPITATTAPT